MATLDEMIAQLTSVWSSATTSQKKTWERFLFSAPRAQALDGYIIPPTEQVLTRLELARQLETTLREALGRKSWRFTASQLAVLFVMPLDLLKSMAQSGLHPTNPDIAADYALQLSSELVREFLSGMSPDLDAASLPSKRSESAGSKRARNSSGSAIPSPARSWEDRPIRNKAEAEKCHKRDQHACLLTGTADPEACHIIPFSFNSTVSNTYRTARLIAAASLFGRGPWPKLLSQKVGSSDRAWNMLAINRQLHFWWGKGFWAIKCRGIIPAPLAPTNKHTVDLQFRWMPRRSELPRNREINLEKGEGEKMLAELTAWHGDPDTQSIQGGIVTSSDAYSYQPLVSGHVFHVCFDDKQDALNMKDMVDLQWSLIVVASLAGAAEADELSDDEDDGAPDAGMMEVGHPQPHQTIHQWLEELTVDDDGSPRGEATPVPSENTTAG